VYRKGFAGEMGNQMHAAIPVDGDVVPHRRHVAVLFVDLTGFTRLVESVDPERVYAVVRPHLEELARVVRWYDGQVQQVLGDGFMSVFGLESQDGTETIRAVSAGLDLVGSPGQRGRLPVHVGVECGEVLVSPSWESAGFGVWGRAVTMAKRLCDLAAPGTVHIGPGAYRTGGSDLLLAGPVRRRLKGIAGDVLVHRVTGVARAEHALALAS
jgi:class 3 adenylate cyclase